MPPKKPPKRRATASPPTSEPADDADVALVPYAAPNATATPSNENKLPDLTGFDESALTALLVSSVPNVPQDVLDAIAVMAEEPRRVLAKLVQSNNNERDKLIATRHHRHQLAYLHARTYSAPASTLCNAELRSSRSVWWGQSPPLPSPPSLPRPPSLRTRSSHLNPDLNLNPNHNGKPSHSQSCWSQSAHMAQ
jgi:hypothetical protein